MDKWLQTVKVWLTVLREELPGIFWDLERVLVEVGLLALFLGGLYHLLSRLRR